MCTHGTNMINIIIIDMHIHVANLLVGLNNENIVITISQILTGMDAHKELTLHKVLCVLFVRVLFFIFFSFY